MDSIPFLASYAALWLLVVVQSFVLLALVQAVYKNHEEHSDPHESRVGLRVGDAIPSFSTTDARTGSLITQESLLGTLTAMLFVSPRCASCMTTLDEVNALRHKARGNVVLVCHGDAEECARVVGRYDLTFPTLVDAENSIGQSYGIPGPPFAVVVNEVGRVELLGKPHRTGELEEMLKQQHMLLTQAKA